MTAKRSGVPHSFLDDFQALITGTALMAFSILLFRQAGLFSGGTAGLALLVHYQSGIEFGWLYFLINLPFYIFAVRALGWVFTVKTFVSVTLLSLFSELLPAWVAIQWMHPAFAAIMGGVLAGVGILMLIRHNASLGGLGVMAIYLQKTRQWRAGTVQMAADVVIVGAALLIREPILVAYSILGALALNLVIAINHRNGRYTGM